MKTQAFNTPILLIIYNRPDLTSRMFEVIKKLKPGKLYIIADGPKKHIEKDKYECVETRKVVDKVDWKCSVKKLFREENAGCKKNVYEGISWFFDNEQEGIILEDDCVPDETFFTYCAELLNKYRHDLTVGHIGGSNFVSKELSPINESYHFSKFCHVWGWATWRRAWKLYDVSVASFPETVQNNSFKKLQLSFFQKQLFYSKFLKVYTNKIDTWDYQWLYTMWKYNLKSIIPDVNLVANIGFDNRATHTKVKNEQGTCPVGKISDLNHLCAKEMNEKLDQLTYEKVFKRSFISNILIAIKFELIWFNYVWNSKKNIVAKNLSFSR